MPTWITYRVTHGKRQVGGGYGPIAGSMTEALSQVITNQDLNAKRFRVAPTGDGGMIATYRTWTITMTPAPQGHSEAPATISDTDAQRTASDWHGGGGSALYQFASTGAIVPGLLSEIDSCIAYDGCGGIETASDTLRGLRAYVETSGERGPVSDWYARVICG